jgi:hypothetical protein
MKPPESSIAVDERRGSIECAGITRCVPASALPLSGVKSHFGFLVKCTSEGREEEFCNGGAIGFEPTPELPKQFPADI